MLYVGYLSNAYLQSLELAPVCSRVLQAASTSINRIASDVFTNLPPTDSTSPTPEPPDDDDKASSTSSALLGIIIGSIVAFLVICGVLCLYCFSRRRSQRKGLHQFCPSGPPVVETSQPGLNNSPAMPPITQGDIVRQWFRRTFMDAKITPSS